MALDATLTYIHLDKQEYVGGVLLVIAVALHVVMSGRWLPWMK